jgi:diguanylate cyclase (GGDEF)-like protein
MFPDAVAQARLNELAFQRMPCGVFSVDRLLRVVMWNDFMAERSGISVERALGKPLFGLFPDLPVDWLKKKFEAVFLLKISAFTSWEHRPYLFRFTHDRPITGGIDWMQQDCTFVPLTEGVDVIAVCVTIIDVTDLAIAQRAREEAVKALREVSIRDALTGLFNRRHAEERLSHEFACRHRRPIASFSVLLLDLDHFKQVNDSYGHPAGDAVLKAVAERASRCLRPDDVLGRFGGEEFIVVLPGTELVDAAAIGERIRRAIEAEPVRHDGLYIVVTASIGAAQVREDATTANEVVRDADRALYEAKAAGRNRLVVASSGLLD